MFPVSGFSVFGPAAQRPVHSAPTQELPDEPEVAEEYRRDDDGTLDSELVPRRGFQPARASLIHPATADAFRQPLDAILQQLPGALVDAWIEAGYTLHVIDNQGRYPLTLELEDFDPTNPGEPDQLSESPEVSWEELSCMRGASSDAEVEEYCRWLERLNPENREPLRLPAFYFWGGRRIPSPAFEFLTLPLESFVAGMVIHGGIEGIRGQANRVVFWDCAFERGDGLLDWYVLHELGHTTDYAFAFRFPEIWREWQQRLEESLQQARLGGRLLTRYAGENRHEYFAEGFAAWARTHPSVELPQFGDLAAQRSQLHRQEIEKLDPMLVELIEEAVVRLMAS